MGDSSAGSDWSLPFLPLLLVSSLTDLSLFPSFDEPGLTLDPTSTCFSLLSLASLSVFFFDTPAFFASSVETLAGAPPAACLTPPTFRRAFREVALGSSSAPRFLVDTIPTISRYRARRKQHTREGCRVSSPVLLEKRNRISPRTRLSTFSKLESPQSITPNAQEHLFSTPLACGRQKSKTNKILPHVPRGTSSDFSLAKPVYLNHSQQLYAV